MTLLRVATKNPTRECSCMLLTRSEDRSAGYTHPNGGFRHTCTCTCTCDKFFDLGIREVYVALGPTNQPKGDPHTGNYNKTFIYTCVYIIAVHDVVNTLGPNNSAAVSFFHTSTGSDTSVVAGRVKRSAWDAWVRFPGIKGNNQEAFPQCL